MRHREPHRRAKFYLVPLSKHILVQENDFVKAGAAAQRRFREPQRHPERPGSDPRAGAPRGRGAGGVSHVLGRDDDKHFEVIVRQMMRKVEIEDWRYPLPGEAGV